MTFHAGKRIHHSHLLLKDAKLFSTLAAVILAYKPKDEYVEQTSYPILRPAYIPGKGGGGAP